MLYLNTADIDQIEFEWDDLIRLIIESVELMGRGEYSQPIKPYIRYKDPRNRIIAMPAYLGGDIDSAGLKWIASFPRNLEVGMPRAHSVTILNNTASGVPQCVINSAKISSIRTAAVSGAILMEYLMAKPVSTQLSIGIIGFGPIAKMHLEMLCSMLVGRVREIFIFDILNKYDNVNDFACSSLIHIASDWQSFFHKVDILLTCTSSKQGYIDAKPKIGSLHLNVSLRDYLPSIQNYIDIMIVDNWEEVCRENTDIHLMNQMSGLTKDMTYSISDVFNNNLFRTVSQDATVMFNPMGMAVFDIAIANYFYKRSIAAKVGIVLND